MSLFKKVIQVLDESTWEVKFPNPKLQHQWDKSFGEKGKSITVKVKAVNAKQAINKAAKEELGLSPSDAKLFADPNGVKQISESMSSAAANVAASDNIPLQDPLHNPNIKRKKFNGCEVFEVDSEYYHKCTQGKQKYHKYEKYVGNGEVGEAIRSYGRANPKKSIIVQDSKTGAMQYLRRV